MNFEFLIARRLRKAYKHKSSISTPIIKIAITVIALGVTMMLITMATGFGLQKKIREKVVGFNGHLVISNFDNNQSKITQSPIDLHQDFYPNFNMDKEIKHIQIFATRPGVIRTESDFEGVVLKGVGKEYDWSFISSYLVEGEIPKFGSELSKQVVLSQNIANRLRFKVGQKCDVFFVNNQKNKLPKRRVFTIVGIYDTGFEEFDKNLMIGDIRQVQKLNQWQEDQVGGFEVFVDDFENLIPISDQIYHQIDASLDSRNLFEQYPQIFEWLKLFDGNIAMIIMIMIVVAGINMITALLVLILERTQLVGVLKTMGAHSWSIRKIFLHNASYIISRGLFFGYLIGLFLLFVQYKFQVVTLDPKNYYVHVAPVYINISHVILLNIGTLLFCVLMMLVPSVIITKISPAKSVKFS